MAELEQRRNELELVNDSVETTCRMDYVSPKKKYVIFPTRNVRVTLRGVNELLEENPEFLEPEEIEYLQKFVKVFQASYTHSSYNVDPASFVELVTEGISAVEARTEAEREEVLTESQGAIAEKIQYLFYNAGDYLHDLKKEIARNFETYADNPLEFAEKKEMVLEAVHLLAAAYVMEFAFLEGNELDEGDLQEVIVASASFWEYEG